MKRLLAVLLAAALLCACSPAEKPLTAEELLSLGEQYLLELDYEQALVQFLGVIEVEPMNKRAYLGAAQAYLGLGDAQSAMAILEQGLTAAGEDEDLRALLEELRAADFHYEIVAVLDVTYRPPGAQKDGIMRYERPVCTGSSPAVETINAFYDGLAPNKDRAAVEGELQEAYDQSPATMEQYGPNDTYLWDITTCQETGRKGTAITFRLANDYYNAMGAHPYRTKDYHAFDLKTGKRLRIDEVLKVTAADAEEVLYREFIGTHPIPDDGGMAETYERSVREQSGLDAQFYFAEDGIHIHYHQHTFSYAAGEMEVVIPYTDRELVREPYWES